MKEVLQVIENEYTIGNETAVVTAGQVVRATPHDGSGPEYLRLQFVTGETFRWAAPVADWSETTPEDDPRWVRE